MPKSKLFVCAFFICSWLICRAHAQTLAREPEWYVRAVEQAFSGDQAYAYDAAVEFDRKSPGRVVVPPTRFRAQWASAPGGKCALRVSTDKGLQYAIVSDGRKTWAHVPSMNRYIEVDGSWDAGVRDPDEVFLREPGAKESQPIIAAELVIPVLARISKRAAMVEMNKIARLERGGQPRQFPVVTVLSARNDSGSQTMTEVALDPETAAVARLEWSGSKVAQDGQKLLVHLKATFENVRMGSEVPADAFTFGPPENAAPANELPIPGLDGSLLRGMAAPDFDIRGLAGAGRLSALRGRTALLAFMPQGGEPASRQVAALLSVSAEYREKLAVVSVGAAAASVSAIPTAADPAGTLGRQYGVHVAPTVVIVDAAGKIAAFLPGVQDTAALKAVLTGAGL